MSKCERSTKKQDGGIRTARSLDKVGKCVAVKDHLGKHLASRCPLHQTPGPSRL